ncbi:hypothetical protein U1Q18_037550, partial [Sarracenia purpurea var. burkii]
DLPTPNLDPSESVSSENHGKEYPKAGKGYDKEGNSILSSNLTLKKELVDVLEVDLIG